jgi:Glycosyl transferase family 11
MISVTLFGRHGNQMWQYAVCRTVAEQNNYQYHIPRDFLLKDIFNCNLGEEQDLTTLHFPIYNPWNNIQFYDPEIFDIPDSTKIDGYLQCEQYILHNRENIKKWFTLKNYDSNLFDTLNLNNDVCVINFRGGDYKFSPQMYLHKKYWNDSINHIKQINSSVKFIVITDDVAEAKVFFPDYEVYHYNIADDFYVVSKAKYLIIANSTFSWWAAWLNDNSKFIIAPKYWLTPYSFDWSPIDSVTSRFHYVDTKGKLFSANECLKERL